jgi:hypothetical protein
MPDNGMAEAFVKTLKRDYAMSVHVPMQQPCSASSTVAVG